MPAVPGAVQDPSRIPTEAVTLGSGAAADLARPADGAAAAPLACLGELLTSGAG
ncbi:MAG: hypothetical protein FWD12_00960 [Alphaproteobacteria bacterium]|nr:hypothetical protein [Alphaproteobacteria bacterium]